MASIGKLPKAALIVLVTIVLFPQAAQPQTITEIIDSTGDGAGNTLDQALGIDIDGAGNVYIGGNASNNLFRIDPNGVITEVMDASGDGAGNPLTGPHDVAVDGSGNVYITSTLADTLGKHGIDLVLQNPDATLLHNLFRW